MLDRRLVCLTLLAVSLAACGKKTPSFEDVPPAEELYEEGENTLEGRRWFWVYTYVDYTEAIDTFHTIDGLTIDFSPAHTL